MTKHGLHGFFCESQPDSRSKDEGGRGVDRAPENRVHRSERSEVQEGCPGHSDSAAVREVQSGVQQGEVGKDRGLITRCANGGRRRCYL